MYEKEGAISYIKRFIRVYDLFLNRFRFAFLHAQC